MNSSAFFCSYFKNIMILNAFFTNDNFLHWDYKFFENDEPKHRFWNFNNNAIESQYDLLPEEVAEAALMTGEYKWAVDDEIGDYFSVIEHDCSKVFEGKLKDNSIKICKNISSNPCYSIIDRNLVKDEFIDSKNLIEDKWVACPRCRAIWAIYTSAKKPLKLKNWDRLMLLRSRLEMTFTSMLARIQDFFYILFSKSGKEIWKKYEQEINELASINYKSENTVYLSIMKFRKLEKFLVKRILKRNKISFIVVNKQNKWLIAFSDDKSVNLEIKESYKEKIIF